MRTIVTALLTLAACALCVRLGFWQWRSWREADAAWTRFARGTDTVEPLGRGTLAALPLYQRVSVTGRLDGQHQFLLDNRSYRGRPGYEVLTPLVRGDGAPLLVDRGWVPFTGSRSHLPDVHLDTAASLALDGRVAQLPSAGLAVGRAAPAPADPWPKVTSFPTPAELADSLAGVLGAAPEARILLLDPGASQGYVRDWQPPGMSPLRHLSYAIQWWCFAALAVIVWAVLTLRRPRAVRSPR